MVDLYWPDRRLVIELDGAAFHSSPVAVERDKRRDRRLRTLGLDVIRITWRQFHHERDEVAADLRAAFSIDLRHRLRLSK